LFSSASVTPALWSDLNGRMNATLAWGGELRAAKPRADSFYVDAGMELTAAAKDDARARATELKAASVEGVRIAEAAASVQKFAYGSDSPDAPLDSEVRELLPIALLDTI